MNPQFEIILIACVISIACSLTGVFLVLRKMSLMSDAISHSVLFGIIITFFVIKNVSSPFLILGAALAGILTVTLTEMLVNTRRVKEDAAIGLVFPFLFSIAVILITKYADNVHIDADAVLLGEIAFAPFNRLILNSVDMGPKSLWVMGAILLVNLTFISLFYKELKLSTFDSGLAAALGFSPITIHYCLMALMSITAVGAFDSVGSILVVALVIAPPSAAYLLTDRLERMIAISMIVGILSAVSGYYAAKLFDVSIGGSMATMSGILFLFALLFAPYKGLMARLLLRRRQKYDFSEQMLLVHLLDHENKPEEKTENKKDAIYYHLKWSEPFAREIIKKSTNDGFVTIKEGLLKLTSSGKETAQKVMMFN